jgi:arsenate reductase
LAAHYHRLSHVLTFSGGTEATAVHPHALATLERAGFRIEKSGGRNPVHLVRFADEHRGIQSFSKVYTNKYNPKDGFCAVMTCDDADEACPVVLGMEKRVALTYEDPRKADGSPQEIEVYDARCRQIAMEMLFMMGQVFAQKFR